MKFETVKDLCEIVTAHKEFVPVNGPFHEMYFEGVESHFKTLGNRKVLNVYPPMVGAGAKSAGFFQVLIGAVLAVAGAATGNPALLIQGIGMMAGGFAQLLQDPPKKQEAKETSSTYSGLPQATTREGTVIPVVFGEVFIVGQLLSYYASTSFELVE